MKIAIIDYLRMYSWEKQTEAAVKYLINKGNIPTIISPVEYKERFIKAMQNYIIEIPND